MKILGLVGASTVGFGPCRIIGGRPADRILVIVIAFSLRGFGAVGGSHAMRVWRLELAYLCENFSWGLDGGASLAGAGVPHVLVDMR